MVDEMFGDALLSVHGYGSLEQQASQVDKTSSQPKFPKSRLRGS